MSVVCQIKDYGGLKKKLEDMKKAPEAVLKNMMSDARKRVPGWVATEVSKVYGIKKKEVMPSNGGAGKAGTVSVRGDNIRNAQVVYRGRVLTPTHFSMTPTSPKADGGYTLKATFLRGQRATLGKVKKLTKKQRAELGKNFTGSGARRSDHSPIMLMRANGGHYLPFQRKSQNRKDIKAVKTISLPQMVSSERTAEGIKKAIDEGLGKRLDHHMQRYMGK